MADMSDETDRVHLDVDLQVWEEVGSDMTDDEVINLVEQKVRRIFDGSIEEIEILDRERAGEQGW